MTLLWDLLCEALRLALVYSIICFEIGCSVISYVIDFMIGSSIVSLIISFNLLFDLLCDLFRDLLWYQLFSGRLFDDLWNVFQDLLSVQLWNLLFDKQEWGRNRSVMFLHFATIYYLVCASDRIFTDWAFFHLLEIRLLYTQL